MLQVVSDIRVFSLVTCPIFSHTHLKNVNAEVCKTESFVGFHFTYN